MPTDDGPSDAVIELDEAYQEYIAAVMVLSDRFAPSSAGARADEARARLERARKVLGLEEF